jgi:hypothetical protein
VREVIVWGAEGCTDCERVMGELKAAGIAAVEKFVGADLASQPADVRRDVMSEVSYQGGKLPVVSVDGRVYPPDFALEKLKEGNPC